VFHSKRNAIYFNVFYKCPLLKPIDYLDKYSLIKQEILDLSNG